MPKPDAHGGESVLGLRIQLEVLRKLHAQTHAGAGQRVAHGNGSAIRIEPGIFRSLHAEVLHEADSLYGKGLVELNDIEIFKFHTVVLQNLFRGRNRTPSHDGRIDADEGGADKLHFGFNSQFFAFPAGHEKRYACAVIQSRSIRRSDMAFRLKRELPEAFDALQRGSALGLFVTVGNSPACGGEIPSCQHSAYRSNRHPVP